MRDDTIIIGGYYWDNVNKNLIIGNNQAIINNIHILPDGINSAFPIPITDDILIQAFGFQQTYSDTFGNQSHKIVKDPLNHYKCDEIEILHVDDLQDLCKDITVKEQALKNLLNQP